LAYVVLGFLILPSSFAFFYYWFQRDSKWANGGISEIPKQDYEGLNPPICCKFYKVLFYTLFLLSLFPMSSLEIVFSTYLTVFGVEGDLKLSKSTMVQMTSVFWFSTLAGKLINTTLTPFLGNRTVIILNFGGLTLTSFCLILLAPYSDILLWITTVMFGIFTSPYGGTGIAYAADILGMSSNLVALAWISTCAGNVVIPFVGGVMFHAIGPTAFLYLLSALIVFMVAMFGMMMILAKKISLGYAKE
jgi:fucose permease